MMRRWFIGIACGAGMMMGIAPVGAQPASSDPARAAIEKQVAAFVDAYNRGDMAAVASMYTEDAIALPPDGEMVKGRAAIEAMWKGARDSGVTSVKLTVLDVESSGILASEVGRATLTTADGDQHVKYVVVWKRDLADGWKLHRDIWNGAAQQ